MANQQEGVGRTPYAVLMVTGLIALAGVMGCTTTTTTRTTTTTTTTSDTRVAQAEPSQTKKPKYDSSGKHRHEHCHIKGNCKNEVCHDHPHEGEAHH